MQRQGDRIRHPLLPGTCTPDRVDGIRGVLRDTQRDRDTGSHTSMILSLYHVSYLIRDGQMAKRIGEGDARDFDETRRLLYMALAAPSTKKYNLVGTLVNALRHHHALDEDNDPSAAQMMTMLISVVDGASDDMDTEGTRWIWAQIGRITDELGD